MTDEVEAATPAALHEPAFDENGVDLVQIRAMLDRTPGERLSLMTEFINSLIALRVRNGTRGSG